MLELFTVIQGLSPIYKSIRKKQEKKWFRLFYFDRTRSGMTSSPIFSFSLCFFFLFLFALTIESSPFSFPSSTPPCVSLLAGKAKRGKTELTQHLVTLDVFLDCWTQKQWDREGWKQKTWGLQITYQPLLHLSPFLQIHFHLFFSSLMVLHFLIPLLSTTGVFFSQTICLPLSSVCWRPLVQIPPLWCASGLVPTALLPWPVLWFHRQTSVLWHLLSFFSSSSFSSLLLHLEYMIVKKCRSIQQIVHFSNPFFLLDEHRGQGLFFIIGTEKKECKANILNLT